MVVVRSAYGTVITTASRRHGYSHRSAINREQQNEMWSEDYRTWDGNRCKARLRVSRETFEYILKK